MSRSALLPHKLAIGGQQRADGAGVGGLAGDDDLAGAVVEGKIQTPNSSTSATEIWVSLLNTMGSNCSSLVHLTRMWPVSVESDRNVSVPVPFGGGPAG